MAAGFISNIDLILLIETSCHFNFTIHNLCKHFEKKMPCYFLMYLLASLELQYKGLTQLILLTWAILNRNYFLSTLETALFWFDFCFLTVSECHSDSVTQQLNLFPEKHCISTNFGSPSLFLQLFLPILSVVSASNFT